MFTCNSKKSGNLIYSFLINHVVNFFFDFPKLIILAGYLLLTEVTVNTR